MMAGTIFMKPVLGAAAAEPFTWWGLAGLHGEEFNYIAPAWIAAVAIVLLSLLVSAGLKRRDAVLPKGPSEMGVIDWVTHMFEGMVETLVELLDSLMPHHHEGRGYAWLIIPIFLYILVNNFLGLVPGMEPATQNANTNFAVAVTVFVLYNAFGFWKVGPAYARHFWAPPGLPIWIAPAIGVLLLAIELVGHLFRPVTLSLRLLGNMTGDHFAFSTFLHMVPLGVPVIFLLLGLLVVVVQAYVFMLLSAVYIALATSHEH